MKCIVLFCIVLLLLKVARIKRNDSPFPDIDNDDDDDDNTNNNSSNKNNKNNNNHQ